MSALGFFWQNQFDQAVAAARVVADGETDDRDFARYVLGQICDASGKPTDALGWYRQVEDAFPDARDAIQYYAAEQVALDEVSTVLPGAPVRLPVRYRNVKAIQVQVFTVDLMTLYLRARSLSRVTQVNLAGIRPMFEKDLVLEDAREYRDLETSLDLELKAEGAYLLFCRGGNAFASGLVLVTSLKLDVREDAATGRVRVTVTDRAGGAGRPNVHVKVLGSAAPAIAAGETDMRGVCVADGVRGAATVIARQGVSQYAFHRGTVALGGAAAGEGGQVAARPTEPATGLRAKLQAIVIPQVEFEDLPVSEVVQILKTRSKELDPDGQGVNIILQSEPAGLSESPRAKEATPMALAPAQRTITMHMDNLPLGEAIRYVCLGAGLQYRVDTNAVIIADRSVPLESMETRFYPVEAGVLDATKTRHARALPLEEEGWSDDDDNKGGRGGAGAKGDMKAFFADLGVTFPAGSRISYDGRTGKLVVHSTPENLRKVEKVLAEVNGPPAAGGQPAAARQASHGAQSVDYGANVSRERQGVQDATMEQWETTRRGGAKGVQVKAAQ